MDMQKLRNDPDAVAIDKDGRFHMLCVWRHDRDGSFAPLWAITTSARTALANMLDRLDNVRQDERLSDRAKQDDEKKVARGALAEMGEQQRRLNQIISQQDQERLKIAKVPPADAAQAVVDIGIAEYFRTLTGDARSKLLSEMVAGSQPRVAEALLRLPTVLFGIDPQLKDTIESNAIARRAPDQVRALQQMSGAIRTTQLALTRAVDLVVGNSGLTLEDRMVSLGDGAWQEHVKDGSSGALAALASRYGVSA